MLACAAVHLQVLTAITKQLENTFLVGYPCRGFDGVLNAGEVDLPSSVHAPYYNPKNYRLTESMLRRYVDASRGAFEAASLPHILPHHAYLLISPRPVLTTLARPL